MLSRLWVLKFAKRTLGPRPLDGTSNMRFDVKLAVCDPKMLRAAIRLLVGPVPEQDRPPLVEAKAFGMHPENIILANHGDQLLGAIVTQLAKGRVGWLWPPTLDCKVQESALRMEIARKLIESGVSRLAKAGSRLIQAIVPPDDCDCPLLGAAGFVQIAELVRMEKEHSPDSLGSDSFGGLEFVGFEPTRRSDFQRVVAQTYEGSRDCPELDGLRPVEEVLESYQGSEPFRPDLWLLAREQGEFVGCVLLAHYEDENRCELQYMGVIPEARGRRLGLDLCKRAVLESQRIGARRLCLSVDSRNFPATNQYEALGFVETKRRAVYILRLDAAAAAHRE